MSVSTTTVIPTEPRWRPTPDQEQRAVALIGEFLADYRELTVEWPEGVELYHGFELFECVCCHLCSARLDVQPWWTEQLDTAFQGGAGFASLDVTTPCCARRVSLNDLDYRGPLGFASWAVTVSDSPRDLSETEIQQIETALGHRIRIVYAHI